MSEGERGALLWKGGWFTFAIGAAGDLAVHALHGAHPALERLAHMITLFGMVVVLLGLFFVPRVGR